MSGARCLHGNCLDSRYKTPELRLFRAPRDSFDVWFDNCGGNLLLGKNKLTLQMVPREKLMKGMFVVCNKHFRPEDILPSGRLVRGTVPIPFIPVIDLDSESKGGEENVEEDLQVNLNVFGELKVYKSPLSHANGKSAPVESMAITKKESKNPTPSVTLSRVDKDVATQLDFNSMSSAMFRARKSATTTEVGPQEMAGPSNIESQPCASTSKIQFETSELHDRFDDPEFGTLDESGMCSFDPSQCLEDSQRNDKEKEKEDEKIEEQSNNDKSDVVTTAVTNESVIVSDEVVDMDTINTKTASMESASAKPVHRIQKDISSANALPSRSRERVEDSKKVEKHVVTGGIISQNKLDSIIDRLECVSTKFANIESVANKIAATALADKYEEFGKYLSSLLRGLPTKKVNSLKKKIVSEVLEALHEEERQPFRDVNMKSVGTQVGIDVLATEKPNNQFIKEQAQVGKSNVSTDKPSPSSNIPLLGGNMPLSSNIPILGGNMPMSSNIPILGGNMPILFSGASTSNSTYQLVPVIPMNSSSLVSSATMVTTTSGPMVSVPPVPLAPCESVTTVATSAEGTLLAVTIPQPKITEPPLGSSNSSSQAPKGQKRKKPTAAYLIKKCSYAPPLSAKPNTNNPSDQPLDPAKVVEFCNTLSSSNPTNSTRQNTDGNTQTEDKTCKAKTDGKEFNTAVRPSKNNEDQEYEMDIEDGNELAEMKEDKDYFETVLCSEESEIFIKEEEPDPDPDDNTSSTPTEPLLCSLCGAHCNDKGQLASHFSTAHPGCTPTTKDGSGRYFVT